METPPPPQAMFDQPPSWSFSVLRLNFMCFKLCPLPLVLSLGVSGKRISVHSCQIFTHIAKIPLNILHIKESQFSVSPYNSNRLLTFLKSLYLEFVNSPNNFSSYLKKRKKNLSCRPVSLKHSNSNFIAVYTTLKRYSQLITFLCY